MNSRDYIYCFDFRQNQTTIICFVLLFKWQVQIEVDPKGNQLGKVFVTAAMF